MAKTVKIPTRKWLKRLIILAISVIALLTAAGSAARTRAVRDYARNEAVKAIHRELGLDVRIDDVDIDPANLAVIARGITLRHPEHGRLAEAGLLRIRPSLLALVQGKIDLKAIDIENASLFLLVRDDRVLNLPRMPEASEDGGEIELPFDWLTIRRSRVAIDASPFGRGEIARIDIEVDGSRNDLVQVRLKSSNGFLDHALGRERLERLEIIGRVTRDNLQLELFRLDTPGLQAAVRRAGLNLPLGQGYHGDLDIKLDIRQLEKWPHGLTLPPLEGHLHLQASAAENESGPSAGGKVVFRQGKIKGYGLGERLELAFEADRESVKFKGVTELIRQGGSLDLEGEIGFTETLPIDVQVKVEEVSFAKLMEQLNISPDAIVDWTLGGGFDLQGTLDPFRISGPLHVPTRDFRVTVDAWHQEPQRRVIGVSTADIRSTVRVDEEGIHLDQIRVGLPRSKLHGSVLLGFDDRLWVKGGSKPLDLDDCTPLLDLSLKGRGELEVQIDGTFMEPKVGGRIDLAGFVLDGYPLGEIKSDYRLEKDSQAVRFPALKGKKRDSRFRVDDLYLDFTDRMFAASGDLIVDSMKLEDFFHIFHVHDDERYNDYRGVISGTSRVRYTLGYPDDSPAGTLDAEIDLKIPQFTLSNLAFNKGYLKGHFTWFDHTEGYRSAELQLERLSLHKGDGTVNISGKMDRNGVLDMVAVADKIAFRQIEGLSARLPDLQGTLAVTGTVKGTAEIPRYDFDVIVAGMTYKGRPLGEGRFYLRLADRDDPWVRQALAWNASAIPRDESCARARKGLAIYDWPADPPLRTINGPRPALPLPMAYLICGQALQGQLQVDLAVGRTRLYPLRGMLDFNNLQLDPFLPQHAPEEPLHGALAGRVIFEKGALLEPNTLVGRMKLATLGFARGQIELRNDSPLDVRFSRGRFEIKSADFKAPSSNLRISGGGSLTRGMALSVDGNVDLGLLSSFSPTISQTRGQARLRFNVTGPLDRPEVHGSASIHKAALRYASFPAPIEELNGNITFSARRVLLENFSARIAGGQLLLKGSAELRGAALGSYAMEIEARHLKLVPPAEESIEMVVGGSASLGWQYGQRLPLLQGTMRLESMRYSKPIQVTPMLSDRYRRKRSEVERYNPEEDRVALDLRVVHSKPLQISNNLLDAELLIRDSEQPFRIVGTDQRFGMLGTMTFKRGVLRFRDRDFDIRQGEITFGDPNRLDPRFDVLAVTDVRRTGELSTTSWHITLHAKGNKDSFDLKTSSDPYLSEEDIALLLAIGMTRAEIEQSQTGDLTETAALEALASVTGVNREVRRAVPAIDDFRIKSAYSESSHRTEPQVSVGKRIADRVRLSASTGLAESREFSTGVQWQLSDQTSVEAMYNNQNNTTGASNVGDVGVDLTWRLEFD